MSLQTQLFGFFEDIFNNCNTSTNKKINNNFNQRSDINVLCDGNLIWCLEIKKKQYLNYLYNKDFFKILINLKEQCCKLINIYGSYFNLSLLNSFKCYGCFCSYNKVTIFSLKISCSSGGENAKNELYRGYELSIVEEFEINNDKDFKKFVIYVLLCTSTSIYFKQKFINHFNSNDICDSTSDSIIKNTPKKEKFETVLNKTLKLNDTVYKFSLRNIYINYQKKEIIKIIDENEKKILEKILNEKNKNIISGTIILDNYFKMKKLDPLINLKQFIKIKKYIFGIINGIKFLHSKSIIHNDLKLSNILYDEDDDEMKIIDFGISIIIENMKILNKFFKINFRKFYTGGTGYYR
jgi:hypothetical protein